MLLNFLRMTRTSIYNKYKNIFIRRIQKNYHLSEKDLFVIKALALVFFVLSELNSAGKVGVDGSGAGSTILKVVDEFLNLNSLLI